MMIALRHTNRPELADRQPQIFQQYLAYLLGDHCWNLVARNAAGDAIAHPAWSQVFAYGQAIRKKAWQLVFQESKTFAAALKASYLDPLTKERNFTTPLALGALAQRRSADTRIDSDRQSKYQKPDKGDKGRGKGKTKTKGKLSHSKTPDGKPICYRYNDKTRTCTSKKCKFIHVCSLCLGKHPAFECRGAARGADTMGEGAE